MREYIVKFDTDEPPSNFPYGTNVRALMKITGDCDEVIRCKDCELFYKNRSPFEQHKCDSGNETGYCFWAVRREE